jgi:hypothetical protein
MYFVLFICIVLVVKAILKLTYYKDNDTFSYYDNISNIIIGVLLFGYAIKMMQQNTQISAMPQFENGSFTNYSVSPQQSASGSVSSFSGSLTPVMTPSGSAASVNSLTPSVSVNSLTPSGSAASLTPSVSVSHS